MTHSTHTISYYRALEQEIFPTIPGMHEIISSCGASREKAIENYPDAAFALMIADNLLCGVSGINQINQKAYLAILRGEDIPSIRFRHSKELDDYFKRHSWDD